MLLPLRLSETRDEFDFSASDISIAPEVSIEFAVMSEKGNEATSLLQLRSSEVRDVFVLSVSVCLV
jgi:hypothetical protein